jgi:hypothetical protein
MVSYFNLALLHLPLPEHNPMFCYWFLFNRVFDQNYLDITRVFLHKEFSWLHEPDCALLRKETSKFNPEDDCCCFLVCFTIFKIFCNCRPGHEMALFDGGESTCGYDGCCTQHTKSHPIYVTEVSTHSKVR